MVKEVNYGFCVEPDNPKKVGTIILQLKNSKNILSEYSQNGKKYVLENHTYDVHAILFFNII